MGKRKVYHVTQRDDGKWQVKLEGASRPSDVQDTKVEAVSRGRGRARNAPLGQLKIHKQDGRIQTEHTYGEDPYPPEG